MNAYCLLLVLALVGFTNAYIPDPGEREACNDDFTFSLAEVCTDSKRFFKRLAARLKADPRVTCKKRKDSSEFFVMSGLRWQKGKTAAARANTMCDHFRQNLGRDDFRYMDLKTASRRFNFVEAASTGNARASNCLDDLRIKLPNGCNHDEILKAMENATSTRGCAGKIPYIELMKSIGLDPYQNPFGSFGQRAMKVFLNDFCLESYAKRGFVDFESITGHNEVFTKAYFDGDTFYNDERETEAEGEVSFDARGRLAEVPGQIIQEVHNRLETKTAVAWPTTVTNFNTCQMNAVMCCWVQDRQAGDAEGSCKAPYDQDCTDADPKDNTDICYHDMSRSPHTARVPRGSTIFPGDNEKGEGPANCHGFVWSKDGLDKSNVYKGNMLFEIAMLQGLKEKGYVKAVPGAPMCGCIEQMPVVSRADCSEIKVLENTELAIRGGKLISRMGDAKISTVPCQGTRKNNDLAEYYEKLAFTGKISRINYYRLRNTIVGDGQCPNAIRDFTSSRIRSSVENDKGSIARPPSTFDFF